jgi:hypothetical protein
MMREISLKESFTYGSQQDTGGVGFKSRPYLLLGSDGAILTSAVKCSATFLSFSQGK